MMDTATESPVLLRKEDNIGFITLNRPGTLNALNGALMAQVTEALAQFQADDDVRVIILSGEGRAFSSGFDLKEGVIANNTTLPQWRESTRKAFEFIMQFWNCPKPTIAAVHGFCLAGALELALSCDITVADDTTHVGEPEVRFGAGVVAMLLPWLIPPKIAKEFLLTGNDRIPVRRAYELGLVNDVVPEGRHLERAIEIARTISRCSPDAVLMTKRAINRGFEIAGMRAALEAGADAAMVIEATDSPEKVRFNQIILDEGLKAAVAWRDERFRGA